MAAKRRITQETFNAAVQENMEVFGTPLADAIEDAMKEFTMQGVDLSNLVTRDLVSLVAAASEPGAAAEGGGGEGGSVEPVRLSDLRVVHPVVTAVRALEELVVGSGGTIAPPPIPKPGAIPAEVAAAWGLAPGGATNAAAAREEEPAPLATIAEDVRDDESESKATVISEAVPDASSAGGGGVATAEDASAGADVDDAASVAAPAGLAAFDVAAAARHVEALKELCREGPSSEANLTMAGELRATYVLVEVAKRVHAAGAAAWETEKLCFDTLAVLCSRSDANRRGVVVPDAAKLLLARVRPSAELAPEAARALLLSALSALTTLATRHEAGKTALKDRKAHTLALRLVEGSRDDTELILAVFPLVRAILTNDDPLVSVSKAFDTSRELASDKKTLPMVLELGLRHIEQRAVVVEFFLLLRAIAITDEICKWMEKAGVLETVTVPILSKHMADVSIVRSVMTFLRFFANSDLIKHRICRGGANVLRLVLTALSTHTAEPTVLEGALAVVANVCLRVPENAELVMSLGAAPLVAQAMRLHPTHALVQRQGCLVIGNVVRRERSFCAPILDEGVEPLLRAARRDHPERCDDVAYAALRDLGLD